MLGLSQRLDDVTLAAIVFVALLIFLALTDPRIRRDILDRLDPSRIARRHPSAAPKPTGLVRLIPPERVFDFERDA